jgi:hypothetical protein
MENKDIYRKYMLYASEWQLNGKTIQERWNPMDDMARLIGSPHPEAHQRLYCIKNHLGFVYSKKEKKFIYEPNPSNRSDDFIINTRFTIKEAFELIHNL